MNHEYELRNFKAFAASNSIPLRPITLVYGPNSSGKSSALQSLLLLKQTLDESETPDTLLLPKGNLVDLGGYREFVHRHDPDRPFSIRLNLQIEPRPPSQGATDIIQYLGVRQVGLRITFGYDQQAANALVQEFEFFVNDLSKPLCKYSLSQLSLAELDQLRTRIPLRIGQASQICKGTELNLSHPFIEKLAEFERSQQISRHSREELLQSLQVFQKQLQMIEDLEANANHGPSSNPGRPPKRRVNRLPDKEPLQEQVRMIQRQLNLMNRPVQEILRSMQERHQRTYLIARNFLPGEIEVATLEEERDLLRPAFPPRAGSPLIRICAQTSLLFRAFLEKLVYLGPLREFPERHYVFSGNVTGQVGKTGRLVPDVLFKNRGLLEKVNQQLTAFGIGYKLIITGSPTGELNDVFSLRLVDSKTGVNASILDVGFGISQVLPVIVQAMLSSGKTLCIEQPEIHLHPRLQAEIGSLLVACTKAPYSNRFIVETHSQHMILRIQRLIREKQISNNEVSVIYVDKDVSGSQCLELRIDKDGDFVDEWPDGFFEEGYREIFAS